MRPSLRSMRTPISIPDATVARAKTAAAVIVFKVGEFDEGALSSPDERVVQPRANALGPIER